MARNGLPHLLYRLARLRVEYNLNINKPEPSTTAFTESLRRPFSQFRNTTVTRSDGKTKYDSLQVSAQQRIGSFTFYASWTWSNNMYNYANLENPYNVTDQWARNADTRRHYFVINTDWRVPVGRGHRFLSGAPGIVIRSSADGICRPSPI